MSNGNLQTIFGFAVLILLFISAFNVGRTTRNLMRFWRKTFNELMIELEGIGNGMKDVGNDARAVRIVAGDAKAAADKAVSAVRQLAERVEALERAGVDKLTQDRGVDITYRENTVAMWNKVDERLKALEER